MHNLTTLFSGLLFGTGLLLSGMTNPTKVQNFLDLFGTWDPSLAFVMGGAIAITMPGFWLVRKRAVPMFGADFQLSDCKDIDAKLLVGASIFGVGWGAGGYCPGPAIASALLADTGTILFLIAMLGGMVLAKLMTTLKSKAQAA